MGIVLALTSLSSTVSFQSAGTFCPPISQKNNQTSRSNKEELDGFASTTKTAAIGPLALTKPLTNVLRYVTLSNRQYTTSKTAAARKIKTIIGFNRYEPAIARIDQSPIQSNPLW